MTTAPLTCLIVDDNEMNRLTLEHFVELSENLRLVGSFESAIPALDYLRQHPGTDLLLLDIEMPLLSGLELARLLPRPLPEVLFVTSHAEFAVEAYEAHATDYLLKPVELPRFLQAVQRAETRRRAALLVRSAAPPAEAPAVLLPAESALPATALFIKTNGRLLRIDFDEVYYIEALSTHSVLVTAEKKHIVYATLKSLAERLPFAHFRRVHRSYIVNTQLIDCIENHTLLMGPFQVPVSKSYQDELYELLPNL